MSMSISYFKNTLEEFTAFVSPHNVTKEKLAIIVYKTFKQHKLTEPKIKFEHVQTSKRLETGESCIKMFFKGHGRKLTLVMKGNTPVSNRPFKIEDFKTAFEHDTTIFDLYDFGQQIAKQANSLF